MDEQMMGMCGTYCGVCDWRERTHCPGCPTNRGKMFWGSCLVATCCIRKGCQHCGFCTELPCRKLQSAFDDPEHGDSGERLANLRSWAKGEQTYLKLTRKKKEGT